MINENLKGTYNVGSNEGMNKKDFALRVSEILGYKNPSYSVINSRNDTLRTTRALDSRLCLNKFEKALQIKLPTLENEVKKLICQNFT